MRVHIDNWLIIDDTWWLGVGCGYPYVEEHSSVFIDNW